MARTKPVDDAAGAASESAVRRYILIAVPLLAVVAAFFLIFWPSIQVGLWMNGLHSDAPEIRRQMRTNLLEAAREDAGVIEQMAEAVADDDRGFNVRQALVGILIELNRMTRVQAVYDGGSLATRAVILARLQREREFGEYWAKDQSLQVPETIRRWLGTTEGSLAFERAHAVQIAMQLDMRDTMPLIRPLLGRVSANVHEDKKRDMLIAAGAAVEKFADCESLPALASLASGDPNYLVRVRAIQNLERAAFGERSACAGAFPEDEMRRLVRTALEDETKEVRMAGMLILEKRPGWATDSVERLEQILAGGMQEGMQGTERRHALHALIGVGDPAFVATLPTYFFDPNPSIRSSCAHKAVLFRAEGPRLESCLIGLARNEVESMAPFSAAMEALRRTAGTWHGLPPKVREKAREGDRKALHRALQALFTSGAVDGVSRDDMVAAWFAWWCRELGLDAGETERMQAARKAFWAAADRQDAAGARAALASLEATPPGLFTYEETWLSLNE